MGPFVRGNLAESGVKKWLFAKNVKFLSLSQTSGKSRRQGARWDKNGGIFEFEYFLIDADSKNGGAK
jgi:hypothetical protein